jgi:hypothetical protein
VYRAFQFHERRQHFVRTHHKTLSVAMRVNNPDRSPVTFRADTHPKLNPALLRLSAMISQYFIGTAAVY